MRRGATGRRQIDAHAVKERENVGERQQSKHDPAAARRSVDERRRRRSGAPDSERHLDEATKRAPLVVKLRLASRQRRRTRHRTANLLQIPISVVERIGEFGQKENAADVRVLDIVTLACVSLISQGVLQQTNNNNAVQRTIMAQTPTTARM